MQQSRTKFLILIFFILLIVSFIVFTRIYNDSPQQSSVTSVVEDQGANWKYFRENGPAFTMRYPETWTHEVLSESSLSGSAETGDKIWYGQVEFSGPEGKVGLTYGDGFGGAICGSQGSFLEGGVLETFTADYDEEFTMCKVPSVQLGTQSEYEYTWVGSCGDCGLLQNTTADQLTTYVFSIESNSENLEGSPIPQIISSLRFRFK